MGKRLLASQFFQHAQTKAVPEQLFVVHQKTKSFCNCQVIGWGNRRFRSILRYKLRTAVAHAVYHSAEATDPDVNACARFETRLR